MDYQCNHTSQVVDNHSCYCVSVSRSYICLLFYYQQNIKLQQVLIVEPAENYKTSEINVLMSSEKILALTYSKIIISRPILENAILQQNIDLSVTDFVDMVQVMPIEKTQLIQVSVTDKSPNRAVTLVNSLSNSFISYIRNLSVENYSEVINHNQKSIEQKQTEIKSSISAINTQNKRLSELEAGENEYPIAFISQSE